MAYSRNLLLLAIRHELYTISYKKPKQMNELIERLTKEAGLTPDQAQKAVTTIANFVKEKFPMLGGAVDQIFAAGAQEDGQ
jgi:hypothetical protein